VCALQCAQVLHTILHRTEPIIFSLTLQTIIVPIMSIIEGRGDVMMPVETWPSHLRQQPWSGQYRHAVMSVSLRCRQPTPRAECHRRTHDQTTSTADCESSNSPPANHPHPSPVPPDNATQHNTVSSGRKLFHLITMTRLFTLCYYLHEGISAVLNTIYNKASHKLYDARLACWNLTTFLTQIRLYCTPRIIMYQTNWYF